MPRFICKIEFDIFTVFAFKEKSTVDDREYWLRKNICDYVDEIVCFLVKGSLCILRQNQIVTRRSRGSFDFNFPVA